MSASRVVVIVHDDWILHLLQEGLREGGFVVAAASSGAEGLARVRELTPDCVLCDVLLPDKDGYAVVAALRAEASIVPIALLAPEDDAHARTAAFEAGADALLTRPFRLEEVVAQMNALVQLARRMRERRVSLIDSLGAGPPSSPEGASFRGELEHMPISSLLTILEIERKTGTVSVRSGKRGAKLELADGVLAGGSVDGVAGDALPVLREALTFESGSVSFRAKPPAPRPAGARPIRALLAEARGPKPAAVGPAAAVHARGQAIPPPPGRRKSAVEPEAPKVEAPKPAVPSTTQPSGTPAEAAPEPTHKPALADIPTRKVNVPEHAPRPQPVHDKGDEPEKPNPPTTRRPG